MGGQHRDRLDHRISGQFGPFALTVRNPKRGQTERGFDDADAVEITMGRSRIQGHVTAHHEFPPRDVQPVDLDRVFARFELDVVTDPDGRNQNAHFDGGLLADLRDA